MFSILKKENNKVVNNYIYLLLVQGANFILPLITLPYLVTTLKPEKYGLVMIAQSLAIFFTIIVDFGFNISATREVAILRDDKKKLSQYFSNVLFIKTVLIFISFLLLISIVQTFDKFQNEFSVYIYSFGLVIGQALFPSWLFQGIEKMKVITIINVLAKFIFTISIFIFVLSPLDYNWVPILNGAGFIISGLIGLLMSLKYVNVVKPKVIEIKQIVKESSSLFMSNFAVSLYTSSNTLILGFFGGDIIAGIYASMEKLIVATKSIYIPLYQALFPYLSVKTKGEMFKTIKKIQPYVFTLGLLLSLFIVVFAEEILSLVYKNDPLIVSNSKVFQILSFIALFSALNMMFVTLFFPAIKEYGIRMKILTLAGLFHLFTAIVFTNFFNIYGVATATLITEILILLFAFKYFKKLEV